MRGAAPAQAPPSGSAHAKATPSGSARLLADLEAVACLCCKEREPARVRLEQALGSDLAHWLVAALTDEWERSRGELLARARLVAATRADDEEDHHRG
jgi:hypothetical protein